MWGLSLYEQKWLPYPAALNRLNFQKNIIKWTILSVFHIFTRVGLYTKAMGKCHCITSVYATSQQAHSLSLCFIDSSGRLRNWLRDYTRFVCGQSVHVKDVSLQSITTYYPSGSPLLNMWKRPLLSLAMLVQIGKLLEYTMCRPSILNTFWNRFQIAARSISCMYMPKYIVILMKQISHRKNVLSKRHVQQYTVYIYIYIYIYIYTYIYIYIYILIHIYKFKTNIYINASRDLDNCKMSFEWELPLWQFSSNLYVWALK